ncbi:hypothetical protein CEK25_002890 [Fusarium fujikuroi]|nr:hypothetical protein CEK25_002890 [Fusarium fujikuroi]
MMPAVLKSTNGTTYLPAVLNFSSGNLVSKAEYGLYAVKFLVSGVRSLQCHVAAPLQADVKTTRGTLQQDGRPMAHMKRWISGQYGKAPDYDENGKAILGGPKKGRLYFADPNIFKGYYTEPGWLKTKESFTGDKTGDIIKIDRKKVSICTNLFKDRKKGVYQELIKVTEYQVSSSGFQVAPSELEGLLEHEGVLDLRCEPEHADTNIARKKPHKKPDTTLSILVNGQAPIKPIKRITGGIDAIHRCHSGKILRRFFGDCFAIKDPRLRLAGIGQSSSPDQEIGG